MFIGDASRPGTLDGLRVLLHSLRRHDARRPFVLMTVEPLRGEAAAALQRAYPLRVVQVPELRSTDAACLTMLNARPRTIQCPSGKLPVRVQTRMQLRATKG